MKYLVIAVLLISSVLSAPAPQEEIEDSTAQNNFVQQGSANAAQIVRYFFDWYPDNEGYRYTYELSDGQIRSEEGRYKDGVDAEGNPVKILVVQGAFSWVAPDGETYWTNYQADEQGYRPKTGKGVGGIKPGEDASIDPNLLKSLLG